MKPKDLLIPALIAVPIVAYLIKPAEAIIPEDATLYIHIKHDAITGYPNTLGKVRQIYSEIYRANKSGLNIGLEPQCTTTEWAVEKSYFQECGQIPTMLTVMSSDNAYMIDLARIQEILDVCNIKWLRFHEALSYFSPFPTDFAISVLEFAKQKGLSVFWNEWNTYTFPEIANIIAGYEDVVAVSFGTNSNQYEPADGFALLSQFQRRAASVQSWYWWERNGRQNGYEFTMPPDLMRQHTQQAFAAGCEIVQYEPFGYFFDVDLPKITLSGVFGQPL